MILPSQNVYDFDDQGSSATVMQQSWETLNADFSGLKLLALKITESLRRLYKQLKNDELSHHKNSLRQTA
ncbi:unnamed protein product [Heterobilharzia americana]|nr:unnamed protein product [Heterobilharzia americana]